MQPISPLVNYRAIFRINICLIFGFSFIDNVECGFCGEISSRNVIVSTELYSGNKCHFGKSPINCSSNFNFYYPVKE